MVRRKAQRTARLTRRRDLESLSYMVEEKRRKRKDTGREYSADKGQNFEDSEEIKLTSDKETELFLVEIQEDIDDTQMGWSGKNKQPNTKSVSVSLISSPERADEKSVTMDVTDNIRKACIQKERDYRGKVAIGATSEDCRKLSAEKNVEYEESITVDLISEDIRSSSAKRGENYEESVTVSVKSDGIRSSCVQKVGEYKEKLEGGVTSEVIRTSSAKKKVEYEGNVTLGVTSEDIKKSCPKNEVEESVSMIREDIKTSCAEKEESYEEGRTVSTKSEDIGTSCSKKEGDYEERVTVGVTSKDIGTSLAEKEGNSKESVLLNVASEDIRTSYAEKEEDKEVSSKDVGKNRKKRQRKKDIYKIDVTATDTINLSPDNTQDRFENSMLKTSRKKKKKVVEGDEVLTATDKHSKLSSVETLVDSDVTATDTINLSPDNTQDRFENSMLKTSRKKKKKVVEGDEVLTATDKHSKLSSVETLVDSDVTATDTINLSSDNTQDRFENSMLKPSRKKKKKVVEGDEVLTATDKQNKLSSVETLVDSELMNIELSGAKTKRMTLYRENWHTALEGEEDKKDSKDFSGQYLKDDVTNTDQGDIAEHVHCLNKMKKKKKHKLERKKKKKAKLEETLMHADRQSTRLEDVRTASAEKEGNYEASVGKSSAKQEGDYEENVTVGVTSGNTRTSCTDKEEDYEENASVDLTSEYIKTSCDEKEGHYEETVTVDVTTEKDGNFENNEINSYRFQFPILSSTWSVIKPIQKTYAGKGRSVRRMAGDWTDVFTENVCRTHPGCVLAFKAHRVKSSGSRKLAGPFMMATAYCKGGSCKAKFSFTIEKEPVGTEEVTVYCSVSGIIAHDKSEINRRNISGNKRALLGEEIRKTSSATVYYDKLIEASTDQMDLGNFTSVPTQAVLRKIVSDVVQQEHLHSNIIAELQILKESYTEDQYIQDIGVDPFTLILFSKKQTDLARKLSVGKSLQIYVDSTGSVISNIPGQKRPYLYSVVVKPQQELPPVSVADMISTQHTIPRIELFLGTFRRAIFQDGSRLKVKKIETDFGLAIIQACLKQFSSTTLKQYLSQCFQLCSKNMIQENFVCLHICAAHMINNFIRALKNVKRAKTKLFRQIVIRAFAALQNAVSMQEAKDIFEDICRICLSERECPEVDISIKKLSKLNQSVEDINMDDTLEEESITINDDVESLTIKMASPYTSVFQNVRDKMMSEHCSSSTTYKSNELFCPEVVQILQDKFLPVFPLWSGILLRLIQDDDEEIKTRDTNVPVENWFKFLKEDRGMKRMRPAKFVITLKRAVEGRLLEHDFPGARRPKTKKRKITLDENTLELEQEKWKRKAKTVVTPKYHPSSTRTKPKEDLPPVMRWGGKYEDITLQNTCTIDNGLTIIHLFYKQHPGFRHILQSQTSAVYQILASVMELMSDAQFTASKLLWVNFIKGESGRITNLLGDEMDYFFLPICHEWKSRTISHCDKQSCYEPRKEHREERGCITVCMAEKFHTTQVLVDRWLDDVMPCNSKCTDGNTRQDEERPVCRGNRKVTRTVVSCPVLVIRLYEHCLHDRITTRQVMKTQEVRVRSEVFQLAGLTLHKESHYCAIVFYKKVPYWYDGLVGSLRPIPEELDRWFPSHAIYCVV